MTAVTTMTLDQLHAKLIRARGPEEVFGPLAAPQGAALQTAYRQLVNIAHPDRNPTALALAAATFTQLERWRRRAQERVAAGVYGSGAPGAGEIRTRKAVYTLQREIGQSDYATLFQVTRQRDRTACVLKLTGDPADNDLAQREAETLHTLAGNPRLARYLPTLIETFLTDDGNERRRASVFAAGVGTYSVNELRASYPGGVDPRDAAWMFNRLLEGLALAHAEGTVHAAVLPHTFHAHVETHGGELTEWGYAVPAGQPLTAISTRYEAWYPPEVLAKRPATAATDLYLAARVLLYLLGAEPLGTDIPGHVPGPMRRLIQACLLPAPHRRPQSAADVRDHFRDVLKTLYGPPAFRPFQMT